MSDEQRDRYLPEYIALDLMEEKERVEMAKQMGPLGPLLVFAGM